MTESIGQKTATQPQRQGGSVPVLFSVRNVQPKIVGAIAQPKPSESPATAAPMSPAIAPSIPIATTSTTTAIKPNVSTSTNNRAYNVAVGLLVIALCLLVIRNTQSSKPNSIESVASNTITSPTESKPLTNLKVELVPPALPSPATTLKPFDLAMAGASSPTSVFSTVASTSVVADAALSSQPLTQNAPMLLNSNAMASSGERAEPPSGSVENIAVAPPRSFPAASVAANNGPSQNNGNSSQPIDIWQTNLAPSANSTTSSHRPEVGNASATTGDANAGVVDSHSPTLTTRELHEMKDVHELIEIRKAKNSVAPNALNGRNFPETNVPATTVSNIAPVSNMPPSSLSVEPSGPPTGYKPYYTVDQGTKDSGFMAGRPYSTSPQEFPSLTVPSYERDAMANRQAPLTAPQSIMPIRQPSTKDSSNRYPGTTQTPYAPLPPATGGSSFGYPPGK